jgi:hypothetical protein
MDQKNPALRGVFSCPLFALTCAGVNDFDFRLYRCQKAWLLLRVFYTDFEHFLSLEIMFDMAQEKRRFFRAVRGKVVVQRPSQIFRMENLG